MTASDLTIVAAWVVLAASVAGGAWCVARLLERDRIDVDESLLAARQVTGTVDERGAW